MHTLAKSLSTLAFATAAVAAAAPASATPTDRFVFEESGSEPGFVHMRRLRHRPVHHRKDHRHRPLRQ